MLDNRDSISGVTIVEFVYSRWQERHVGFFLEPYAYDFGKIARRDGWLAHRNPMTGCTKWTTAFR